MIIAILTVAYLLIIYCSYTVNVFQFGLFLYDNAEGDVFDDLAESERNRLNEFFGDVGAFNLFVTLFNNFASIVSTTIALIVIWLASNGSTLTYAIKVVVALSVTLLLNFAVAQTLSKRVPNSWIDSTLKSRLWLVQALFTLFRPILSPLAHLSDRYKREQLSEEQKEDMVERAIESLAESAGLDEPLVEEDEKEMIGNIFELDQTAIKEIMVPRTEIVGIRSDASFEEIQKVVVRSGHSRFPVFDDDLDEIKGIVYVKDLFGKFPLPDEGFNLLDYVREPHFVPETKITSDLMEELKRSRNHIAIVADEYGGTAGLVTMEDLLEVIVGDIQDEHDREEEEIVKLDDGSFRVDANVPVEDLAERAGIEIEENEFETVGGLIYDLVGSLPHEGQVVSNEYFKFTVEKMEGQSIEIVRVELREGNEED
jgi:CBS domain containing-hemolysin-like protein